MDRHLAEVDAVQVRNFGNRNLTLAPQSNILIMGHVNLDVICRCTSPTETGAFSLGENSVQIGGSVANVGRASRSRFARRTAVCCVGGDSVGMTLANYVADEYDAVICRVKDGSPSGVVTIIYRPEGREVIGPFGSANDAMTIADIHAPDLTYELQRTDVLVIDGYLAVSESGRAACEAALKKSAECGALTVIDVVPHHADRLYSLTSFKELVRHAAVVIVEASTLSRFFGLGDRATPDAVTTEFRTAFPEKLGILRFGELNIRLNRFVASGVDLLTESQEPTSRLAEAGYGDELTVDQICEILSQPRRFGR